MLGNSDIFQKVDLNVDYWYLGIRTSNNDILYTKQNLRIPTMTTENMRLIHEHMTEKSGYY